MRFLKEFSFLLSTLFSSCVLKDKRVSLFVRRNRMLFRTARVIFLSGLFLSSAELGAADWPGWRGADGNGVSDQAGFPQKWSQEKKKNLS
ncbi:MAG: hypothetical protein VX254_02900, partial [Planctomycetota bacterium]|nr:hypothetical protein [Planctomycetota bacterium]